MLTRPGHRKGPGRGAASMQRETSGGSLPHVDLLRQVASGLTSRVEEILGASDLTLDQWRGLHTLDERGPLSMSDLSSRTPGSGPAGARDGDRLGGSFPIYRNLQRPHQDGK